METHKIYTHNLLATTLRGDRGLSSVPRGHVHHADGERLKKDGGRHADASYGANADRRRCVY